MNKTKYIAALCWVAAALLAGCSATKSVPDGAALYTGAKIDFGENEKLATKKLTSDLYEVLVPEPNDRIAGLPIRLYLYQFFDNGKEKGIMPWLRDKLGQPPVLYKPDYPRQVEQLLENRLFNNGYFDGSVDSEITLAGKKASVLYRLQFDEPYRVASVSNRIDHSGIGPLVRAMPPSEVLRPGDVYTLGGLRAEAERIELYLKQKGYYYFSRDYLMFQVDSTHRDRTVDLRLKLREDAPPKNLRKSFIRNVVVYPDFGSESTDPVTKKDEGVTFQFRTQPQKFRTRPLLSHIFFRPGDPYNLEYHHNTLKRLINLNSLSFANVNFYRPPGTDSLDMAVNLAPRRPQTIQGSVSLSYKNSQYIGPELELTYINRNLFRGSENLRIRGFTNLNFPVGDNPGQFYENSGLDLTFTLPGLRTPWRRQRRNLTLARTKFNLSYERESTEFPLTGEGVLVVIDAFDLKDLQEGLARDSSYAPSIGINSLKFTFGYQWQRRPDILHELNPIGLGLQFDEEETPDLKFLIEFLLSARLEPDFRSLVSLEDMIYWNPDYTFLYDSRNIELKRHNFFYRGRLSLTGNQIFPDQEFEFADVEEFESLFLQTENDFRYYYITPKKKHTLATRFIMDLSMPFGEELFLPFLDLYTVGGPNSLRAYSLRELGPGTLSVNDTTFSNNSLWLFAGKGDMHLESSIEFRYKVTSMFETAVFADVGNIWLVNSNTEKANFRFDRFYKELGLGVGFGLRLNIDPLVLRLDLAMPLTKPWLPEEERWVGNQIDLFSGSWRKNNLQFNLSFGYPF